MKTESLRLMPGRATVLLSAMVVLVGTAAAQQQPNGYSYPPGYAPPPSYPQYPRGYDEVYEPEFVPPHQFFKMFGRRFGEMFRGLFYGEEPPPGYERTIPGGRSLDSAPPSYGSHYDPQPGINVPPRYEEAYPPRYQPAPQYQQVPQYQPAPRYDNGQGYETPRYEPPRYEQPRQRTVEPAPVPETPRASPNALPESKKSTPSTKSKTQSTPPKKYTPPTITRTPAQQKLESQPPPPIKEPETKSKVTSSPPSSATANKSETAKTPATSGNNGSFLKGKRTGKPGRVTSPYPPYQELDVTGLSAGSLALDPTTQKVFEVP